MFFFFKNGNQVSDVAIANCFLGNSPISFTESKSARNIGNTSLYCPKAPQYRWGGRGTCTEDVLKWFNYPCASGAPNF